jgi:hypothetical protein
LLALFRVADSLLSELLPLSTLVFASLLTCVLLTLKAKDLSFMLHSSSISCFLTYSPEQPASEKNGLG